MTKPGFVLKRTQQMFQSDDIASQNATYIDWCHRRITGKFCYCGHTFDCDCSTPSFNEFKEALLNGNIKEKDL
jgi:hypothetical protein